MLINCDKVLILSLWLLQLEVVVKKAMSIVNCNHELSKVIIAIGSSFDVTHNLAPILEKEDKTYNGLFKIVD